MIISSDNLLNSIKQIRHACIKFNIDDKIVYFDPFDINKNYFDADIIFITHPHDDHFSIESIKKITKSSTTIIVPRYIKTDDPNNKSIKSEIEKLIDGSMYNEVIEVEINEKYAFKGINFETVPAYNKNHPKENEWLGYTIDVQGSKVYVAGDTEGTQELKNLNVDVVILPIDGAFNMSPIEAVDAIKNMKKKPRLVIPYHFENEKFDKMFNINTKGKDDIFKTTFEKADSHKWAYKIK